MKKLITVMTSLLMMCLISCVTTQDIEKKMATGEGVVTVTYDYDWEKVYDAIRYVLLNTDVRAISTASQGLGMRVKCYDKERAIVVMFLDMPTQNPQVKLSIRFEQVDKLKTKVKFIPGRLYEWQEQAIECIIDESKFVLQNDGKGYMKYTEDNAVKYEEQLRKKQYK